MGVAEDKAERKYYMKRAKFYRKNANIYRKKMIFYKLLAYDFYMMHEEFPIEIDFRNGITAQGVGEGEVKGRAFYKNLIDRAEQVFGTKSTGEENDKENKESRANKH